MDTNRVPQPRNEDDTLKAHYSGLERLRELEDDLKHADLGAEERCELQERVSRLSRNLR